MSTTTVSDVRADADSPAQLRHLIAGEWREGTGAAIARRNPARPSEIVATGHEIVEADIDAAVAAAQAAARDWARTPAHERGAYLIRAAAHLEAAADGLARELAREEGKALPDARGEVGRAIQILRYYGSDADRESGQVYSSPRSGERILVTHRPLGVVAVVTPFNFPIAIPAWKIAPALAYGNTVIWKPASAVPLLAVRLAEALDAAGLPAGVLNLVIGPGALGSRLAGHPGLDGLTFTGSTGVGRGLAVQLAGLGTPYQAEMGGKNSSIVLADADLDVALDAVVSGAFRSSGQRCTATSRLIVEEPVADEFLGRLGQRTAELVVGDPLDSATYLGPVVDERAKASLQAAIAGARSDGLVELFGREDYADGELGAGHFVSPTVFQVDGESRAAVWHEELFGPVLAVRRVADADEAFASANDTEFGLSGSLFTRDLGRALHGIDEFHIGVLHVNSESAGADPHVPFGGVKQSGYGPKEQGQAAKQFFTETTTVYLRG